MSTFTKRILPYVEQELAAARECTRRGDAKAAFAHLERAHILGQRSTRIHTRVHGLMFLWGLEQKSFPECLGQALRIIGAATKTVFGLVPTGNTGGNNVSPFKVMPIPPDLEAILRATKEKAPRN